MVAITALDIPTILNVQQLQLQLNTALDRIYAAIGSIMEGAVPFGGSVATTNATATTIETIPIATNTTTLITAFIVARRTGGTGGTTGDGAGYQLNGVVKNIAGTVTIIAQSLVFTGEDQAGWTADLAVSTTNILVRVTGAADNNINWTVSGQTLAVA